MAIMGYSQGAQVAGDTLCGRSDKGFEKYGNTAPFTAPGADMSTHPKSHNPEHANLIIVIATILFSDLGYVPAQLPYNIGTANATETGRFARQNLTGCAPFNSGLRTYCDHGDTWCASAPIDAAGKKIHGEYVDKYTTPASKWVAYKYKEWLAAH